MSNLISIFLLVASAGIFFGYVRPTYGTPTLQQDIHKKSIVELIEDRDRYVEAINKTREIEQVRVGLLAKYNQIPLEDKERILKFLPDHVDSVRLIIDVNNIASEYGMTLKNIGLTGSESEKKTGTGTGTVMGAGAGGGVGTVGTIGPQTANHFKAVGLKFNVSGSYDNFRAFLKDLESSLRLVNVTAVTFKAGESATDYSVTLSTYYLQFEKNEHL